MTGPRIFEPETGLNDVSSCFSGIQQSTKLTHDVVTLRYNGAVYSGQAVKHGFDTELDKYGNRYEGQWYLDEKVGQGKLMFQDGSSYEGNWRAGKFHGQGTLKYSIAESES